MCEDYHVIETPTYDLTPATHVYLNLFCHGLGLLPLWADIHGEKKSYTVDPSELIARTRYRTQRRPMGR